MSRTYDRMYDAPTMRVARGVRPANSLPSAATRRAVRLKLAASAAAASSRAYIHPGRPRPLQSRVLRRLAHSEDKVVRIVTIRVWHGRRETASVSDLPPEIPAIRNFFHRCMSRRLACKSQRFATSSIAVCHAVWRAGAGATN